LPVIDDAPVANTQPVVGFALQLFGVQFRMIGVVAEELYFLGNPKPLRPRQALQLLCDLPFDDERIWHGYIMRLYLVIFKKILERRDERPNQL